MIVPDRTSRPSPRYTPSRCPTLSRPFLLLLPAFLCAIAVTPRPSRPSWSWPARAAWAWRLAPRCLRRGRCLGLRLCRPRPRDARLGLHLVRRSRCLGNCGWPCLRRPPRPLLRPRPRRPLRLRLGRCGGLGLGLRGRSGLDRAATGRDLVDPHQAHMLPMTGSTAILDLLLELEDDELRPELLAKHGAADGGARHQRRAD